MATTARNVLTVHQKYIPMSDTLQSGLFIQLKNGKEVYALFDHDDPFTITNEELIMKLRALADHIEKEHGE